MIGISEKPLQNGPAGKPFAGNKIHNQVLALTAVLSLGLMVAASNALAAPKTVLELFTSQGCSSCPPADHLLESLASKDDILALSLPVDYWDYLGWKDTLGSRANSDRQRAYAIRRGDRSVYTPQIVVNGSEHVVGSNQKAVKEAIIRAEPLLADLSLSLNDMAVEARIQGTLPRGEKMATVFFGMLSPEVEVPIGRGENAGATVNYINVVHHLQPIGMWSGGEAVFRMPKSEVKNTGMSHCVVLVQLETDAGPGRVIAANTLDFATGH